MPRFSFRGPGAIAAVALAFCASIQAQPAYVYSTFAGAPNFAYADGPLSSARFALVQDLAVDSAGTIYVTDLGSCLIRKISKEGVVTTIAGKPGEIGKVDGPPDVARLGSVGGVAVDNGVVYFSDALSNTIRRIGTDGSISTYAGSGVQGSADGTRTTAAFKFPAGIAFDSVHNMYVADYGNATIRKITSDGTVTTVAGSAGVLGATDGVGSAARFVRPFGIAISTQGVIYVSDWGACVIRKIAADGTVTTVAGEAGVAGSSDGVGSAAHFGIPAMLEISGDNTLYVADRGAYNIRKISLSDSQGTVTTIAGRTGIPGYQDGTGTAARFMRPTGVGIDKDGIVYIGDTYNGTIRRMDANGTVTTLTGRCSGGTQDAIRADASFYYPTSMAMDSAGNLFVADCWNHTIRKVTPQGVVTTFAGAGGVQGSTDGAGPNARFRYPRGLAFDKDGNLFVADETNATIRKITPAGVVSTFAGQALTTGTADGVGTAAQFRSPAGLTFDSSGNLWVSDTLNNTIRRITPDGTVTTVAGRAGIRGSADGAALEATFYRPDGLVFDSSGNLYIADYGNHTIRAMTPGGTVVTVVGRAGTSGSTDGTLTAARLNGPSHLAFDRIGRLFVTEDDGNGLRMITGEGTVTTVGGFYVEGSSDGLRPDARLWGPNGIVADATGNLWIADSYNHTIRCAAPIGVAQPTSQLRNLSVRTILEPGKTLIAGFVGTGNAKPMLIRAVGPGLKPYVGDDVLASNPHLQVYDSAEKIVDSNEDWGGTANLMDTFAKVGAFPLPNASLDAAVARSIAGLHTVHVGAPSSGMALVEAYDAGTGSASRLVNVSARYGVTAGNGVLIAGFVIDGTGSKTFLIRGVGPTLTTWKIPGMLTDPVLEIYNTVEGKIASNDDWAPGLASTFKRFAFDLDPASKDAAIIITLPPGSYSAQLTGKNGTAGEGLVEIYEIGN